MARRWLSRKWSGSAVQRGFVWLAKTVAVLAVLVVAFSVLLLTVLWWEHDRRMTLPVPGGPFAVGRTTFAWTNAALEDEFAPRAEASKRQVLVWVWYPAIRSRDDAAADYLPPPWQAALRERWGFFLRWFVKHDPAAVEVHSVAQAEVAREKRAYPVVLLRAGGSALTTDFTTVAESLASYGFFVVGFDAPYRTFVVVLPDGRRVARSPAAHVENANGNLEDPVVSKLLGMWTADTAFVVDQLERLNGSSSGTFGGRMDLARLGMVGHSFGGATALEFCREDTRCKAACDLDGIPFGRVVEDGLKKPGMFLLSDHRREMDDPETHQVLARMDAIYNRLPPGSLRAVMRGSNHFSFSDQILLNSQAATGLLRVFGVAKLEGRRGLAITTDLVERFFEVHLAGKPVVELVHLEGKYPEVEVERR